MTANKIKDRKYTQIYLGQERGRQRGSYTAFPEGIRGSRSTYKDIVGAEEVKDYTEST